MPPPPAPGFAPPPAAAPSRAVTSVATPRARVAWWTRLLNVFGIGKPEYTARDEDEPSAELRNRLEKLVSELPSG
jgi:hypothetical protein